MAVAIISNWSHILKRRQIKSNVSFAEILETKHRAKVQDTNRATQVIFWCVKIEVVIYKVPAVFEAVDDVQH